MSRILSVTLLYFLFVGLVHSQTWNPFDIKNRSPEKIREAFELNNAGQNEPTIDSADPFAAISQHKEKEKTESTFSDIMSEHRVNYMDSLALLANPYDVIRVPKQAPLDVTVSSQNEARSGILFIIHMILLLLLGILISLYRGLLPQMYKAMFNSNYMKLLQRRSTEPNRFKLGLFYSFFFINAGLFLFQTFVYFSPEWKDNIVILLLCILGLSVFFGIKHALFGFISIIFPLKKEINFLSFSIMVANGLTGILLVPVNLIMAFADPSLWAISFYTGLVFIIGMYLIKQLKALFLSASVWMNNVFHFFLYLCAVEIAPITIIWKLFQSWG